MYQIRPETLLTFVEDKTVRFPRFQRKQTWNHEQNFKLIISIFKNFPLGITIINKQTLQNRSTRWLLDGRQRRNAILLAFQDPENIYEWSRKLLGIKATDQPQDIKNKYWEKMEIYLNDADEVGFDQAKKIATQQGLGSFYFDGRTYDLTDNAESEIESDGELTDEILGESNLLNEINLKQQYNQSFWGYLDELLFIILVIHVKTPTKSGFSAPFDFRKTINGLPYVENGDNSISSKKLKTFIQEFIQYCFDNYLDFQDEGSLLNFYNMRFQLDSLSYNKLQNKITQNWDDISNSIKVIEIIKNRLQESNIGIIETSNITATDAQMIFMLINKEGTKLSAVEILSAKPAWNIKIENSSQEVEIEREKLYNAINTAVEDTVKWDYPATIFDRLDKLNFIFPKLKYDKKNELEKKLTLGFKILSGIYQKGIKKEDVDSLSLNRTINWVRDIENLVKELNDMGRVVETIDYFKSLKSLGKTFNEITSDAIALNFLFSIYFDFKKKDRPISGKECSVFKHNTQILADRLIYDYVNQKWRGSSDSKIARNIKEFDSLPDKFEMVSRDNWLKLIKGINDEYKIDDVDLSFSISKTIVYHVYATHKFQGQLNSEIDIDHIIPQSKFDSSNIANADLIKNSLFNLCPLPTKENIKKRDKALSDITDIWLTQQIAHYSNIPSTEFVKYSNVLSWNELRTNRREFYEDLFLNKREENLNI